MFYLSVCFYVSFLVYPFRARFRLISSPSPPLYTPPAEEFFRNIGIVSALGDQAALQQQQQSSQGQQQGGTGDAFLIGQYSAAILYNLSLHEVLCKDLYEDGATVLLIQLAQVGRKD